MPWWGSSVLKSSSRANEAGFVGEHHELGAVAFVELNEDPADVGAGGAAPFGPSYSVSGQQTLPFIAATGLIVAMTALLALSQHEPLSDTTSHDGLRRRVE